MTEVKCVELTTTTIEILEMITAMRHDIESSMMVGERNILRGIDIFEKILKEINPDTIDSNQVIKIEEYISLKLQKDEDSCQRVNSFIHYGINRCYSVLEAYNKYSKGNSKKRVKHAVGI